MNMGALVWGIGGGLLLYFLTCNFLTLLVKPSWDKPIRTISDLLERDMGLILWPGMDYYIEVMRDSPVDQYNKESFDSQIVRPFNSFPFPAVREKYILLWLGYHKCEGSGKLNEEVSTFCNWL